MMVVMVVVDEYARTRATDFDHRHGMDHSDTKPPL